MHAAHCVRNVTAGALQVAQQLGDKIKIIKVPCALASPRSKSGLPGPAC